jgi:hypothetical protein
MRVLALSAIKTRKMFLYSAIFWRLEMDDIKCVCLNENCIIQDNFGEIFELKVKYDVGGEYYGVSEEILDVEPICPECGELGKIIS